MNIQQALITVLLGFSTLAWGNVSSEIDIRASGGNEIFMVDSAPVEDTFTHSYQGGTATAYANLATGILREYAVAPPLPSNDFSYSVANSRIDDTITFNHGATGTAFLEWSVDGTLPAFDNVFNSTATFTLVVSGAGKDLYEATPIRTSVARRTTWGLAAPARPGPPFRKQAHACWQVKRCNSSSSS